MAVLNGPKKVAGLGSIAAEIRLRLDAHAHGDCDYETLAAAVPGYCKATPEAVWEVLSILDQYHRRGTLSDEVFRSLKASASYIALGMPAVERTHVRKPTAQKSAATRSEPENNTSIRQSSRDSLHRPLH